MVKVFGPIPSRRLGRSLGINNIPHKVCSYSCIYCQVGRTSNKEIERSEFYKPEYIVKEIADKLNCSVKTLNRRLKVLSAKNWIYFQHNHLFIRSLTNISKSLGVDTKTIHKKRTNVDSSLKALDVIRLDLIKYNLSSQKLSMMGKIEGCKTQTRIFKKSGLVGLMMHQIGESNPGDLRSFYANLDNSISRGRISKLLKFKNKSGAQQFLSRVESYGWITQQNRTGLIEYVPGQVYAKQANLKHGTGCFVKDGKLIKKISTKIIFKGEDIIDCAISKRTFSDKAIKTVLNRYNNLIAKRELLTQVKFKTIDGWLSSFTACKVWGKEESNKLRRELGYI